jgi:putative hydrolase of the HAD superfamily
MVATGHCHPTVIRRIFFDAAGTLIKLAEPVGEVYARLAGNRGVVVQADALQTAFQETWRATAPPAHPEGKPPEDDDRSWWRAVVRRTFDQALSQPLPDSEFGTLFDDLYGHFARADAWRLFDDVLPALDVLGAHFELHVLSNFDRRLHGILAGLGIADRFRSVTLSSVVGASKPSPRVFAWALTAARGEAASSLHVGDEMRADVLGATAAGFYAWQVKRPGATLLELAEKLPAQDYSCLQPPNGRVCMPPPKTERG